MPRNCWSTLPRRRIASTILPAPIHNADDGTSVIENVTSHHQATTYNKTFSCRPSRRPRQTIFNVDTSVGKAMATQNPEQVPEQAESGHELPLTPTHHRVRGPNSPSKKSVEFELPNGARSGVRPHTPPDITANGDSHVVAPNNSGHSSGPVAAASSSHAPSYQSSTGLMMPPPSFGWAPFYQSYPQGYSYMAGPFTPHHQGNEGMMQPYMTPPYPTHPMFYNNMMMPAPTMMATPPGPPVQHSGAGQNNDAASEYNPHKAE